MKINLKKLAEVEKKYTESGVSIDVLRVMVSNVLNFQDTSYSLAPNNIKTSINTLIDLKILVEDAKLDPPVQQLNS
jgi:hypothetical protein